MTTESAETATWAKAASTALIGFDQRSFEAAIEVLTATELASLVTLFTTSAQTADTNRLSFDALLYRAGAAMADALIYKRLQAAFETSGGYCA